MNPERARVEDPPKTHALWIARACRAARVPLWLGVPLFGLLPFPVLLFVGAKVAGLSDSLFAEFIVPESFLTLLLVLVPILGTIFLSRTTVYASVYAESLLPGPQDGRTLKPVNLESLYSARFFAPIGILVYVAVFLLYYEFGSAPTLVVLASAPAVLYGLMVISGAIWVYAYSMYSIWKIGELPLVLKAYAEDRALGLRPFGSASLKLTVVYVALVAASTLSAQSLPLLVRIGMLVAFSLVGIGLFLLPLFGLHRKLLAYKAEKMVWISAEHSAVMKEIEAPGGLRDWALTARLAAVRSIRGDVSAILDWPFDSEIIVRLITLVVLPLIIALAAPFIIPYL